MAKLNQVIAVEKAVKPRANKELTEVYHLAQKPQLFDGMSKVFESLGENGEQLPPESKRVQYTVKGVLERAAAAITDLFTIKARLEWGNTSAKGDVTVDGTKLLSDVPVGFLLFLEKQLVDVRTFVASLPTLDAAEDWKDDPNTGLWRTDVTKTHRTKKTQRALVKYPATEQHPAQTEMISEDVISGYWNTTKLSGAMQAPVRDEMVKRVDRLIAAVKTGREQANAIDEVPTPNVSKAVIDYVFGAQQ